MRSRLALAAVAAAALPISAPASADHDYCANTHDFYASTSGTVTSTNRRDYWRHRPLEHLWPYHNYALTMSGGDADLYVWNFNCTALLGSSARGGEQSDTVAVIGVDAVVVEVRYYSSAGGTISYNLRGEHLRPAD